MPSQPDRITPEQMGDYERLADSKGILPPARKAIRDLAHEVKESHAETVAAVEAHRKLRDELELAFSPGMYLDIQIVLDKALGTNEADGAGGGIVADVALVAERMRAAEAEVKQLTDERERARDAAVALEQENARLLGEVTT